VLVLVLGATVVDDEVEVDGAADGVVEHEASPMARPPAAAILPASGHARCPMPISPRSAGWPDPTRAAQRSGGPLDRKLGCGGAFPQ
jgi:hypothetical protein